MRMRLRQIGGSIGPFALAFIVVLSLNLSAAGQRRRPARETAPPIKKSPARASQQPALPPTSPEVQLERLAPDPSVEEADIAITGRVKASSLRFDEVPTPKVEFPGQPQRDTVWEAQRENLPTPVEPGVTYRDIGIRLKITSVFSDIDRIVAEALGEIPIVDGKPSTSQASTPVKKLESPISQSAPSPVTPKERP